MSMENLTPITREEKIVSGEDLEPITRMEYFLKKYGGGTGGGTGGGSSVLLDTTLTKSGYAADAKAVGDALKNFEFITEADIDEICGETIEVATANEVKF